MKKSVYIETTIPSYYFETREGIDEYIKHNLLPKEYGGDAYHLAYASFYEISFLMTWNCKHLANPNKFHHLHVINGRLGLHTPIICTPEQLLTEGDEL